MTDTGLYVIDEITQWAATDIERLLTEQVLAPIPGRVWSLSTTTTTGETGMVVRIEDTVERFGGTFNATTTTPAGNAAAMAWRNLNTYTRHNEARRGFRICARSAGGHERFADVSMPVCCVGAWRSALGEDRRVTSVTELIETDQEGSTDVSTTTTTTKPEKTAAEIQAEFDAFKVTVGRTAMRYAKVHDWCGVVKEALSDVGIEPVTPQKLRLVVEIDELLDPENNNDPFDLDSVETSWRTSVRFYEQLEGAFEDGLRAVVKSFEYFTPDTEDDL